jgi:hypothetical protein
MAAAGRAGRVVAAVSRMARKTCAATWLAVGHATARFLVPQPLRGFQFHIGTADLATTREVEKPA